ncbi:receptor-type tyrosine-protein phosphatase C isoform X2 [Chelonia mydas]|uniref:receptor-type tyrosine-protein phosphatase C isoform X2 n=1 Tax=Chelonia mydas TaxID=8469 RepID=UPI001CA8FB96|nr:receptor-type tyrosine-protein phosphatase C isoform X2 [Chelonia mydas]XP_043377522.1 receptor-type tyrosine-protein phosphatase C isoform X2 [Chelonia mydas]XP_043377523.1 receptor-type tyrosine-protein phosphatase C isoform X2 [Chelonia mydas]
MTMFLWLELLAFGFALLDNNVFVKGEGTRGTADPSTPTTTSLLRTNSTPHSPTGDNKERMIDPEKDYSNTTSLHFSPSTSLTPTSTTTNMPESSSDTSHSMTTASPPKNDTTAVTASPMKCDNITLEVERYSYTENRVSAKVKVWKCDKNITSFTLKCTNCTIKNDTIEGLQECQTYDIEIEVNGSTRSYPIHVPPDEKRYNFTIEVISASSLHLKWTRNNLPKCNLTYFYACSNNLSGQRNYSPVSSHSIELTGLSANTPYNCTSKIIFLETNKTIKEVEGTMTTDFGKPDKPESLDPVITTPESVTFNWKEPSVTTNGPIDGYIVKCCERDEEKDVGKITSYNCTGFQPYTEYTVSVNTYTNTKKGQERSVEPLLYKGHTDSSKPGAVKIISISQPQNNAVRIKCEGHAPNGKLQIFYLKWDGKVFNKSKCDFLQDNLYYLTTYDIEIYMYNGDYEGDPVKDKVTTKYNSQALIIFLAFLIIVTSIALLIVLYKIYDLHREKLSNSGEDVMLVKRDDEKQLMNVEPIPSEMLLETYKRKIADEGRLFLDEFQSIPRVFSKFSIKEARKNYNQNKNRYIDILPYDYNRVELSEINGDPGSDYINASHIDGFKEPRKYIAAQGPKDETTDDFWRMIWEQKATIIVMVTRCEENNRNKCAQYWPTSENSTATFGDTVVKSNESKICPDYIIQKLHITNRKEKTPGRDVTHIQFTSWPDHGVPEDPHLLLKLRRRVNALSNFFSGPVVIHCSAGVGRTGTYIAIDAMLEGLEVEGRVDVYGYVVKLRRQRCLMVQVETQYILIHQALVEYNQFGETEVTVSELHTYLNNLKKRDPPSDPSLLEAEFQRLPSYRGWRSQNTGNRQENKSKNRNSKMIPYDFNRVPVKHEEEKSKESEHDSEESSDEDSDCEDASRYINASFITGYWGPKEMIATQGPLPETINDFWQMIFQRKVKVIVMLTELNEGDQQLCAQYWEEGKQRYEGIEVEMKDVNLSSSYTIRAFDVTHVKRKETRNVYMYQYHRWNGLDLPENPKDLVTMILNLKQKLAAKSVPEDSRYSRSVPIVIHCRDGSEQTGVFCALLTLLESAETEDVIDVFQVVKSLRRERPGMVPTFEQYQFLYDTVSSIYPAQNGQVKKNSKQEDTIEIDNEVEKTDQEANLITIDITSLESEANMNMEACEDSKSADGTQGTESSSNGPKTPVLTESA